MNRAGRETVGHPRKFNEELTDRWTLETVNLRLGATWKSGKAVGLKRLFRAHVTVQGFTNRLQYIGEYKLV